MYTVSALEDLGALQHLDPVLVSEKEGIEKPSRDIFIRACERAGVEPRNAIHVGDELVWYVPSFSFPFNLFIHFVRGVMNIYFSLFLIIISDYNGATDAGLEALLLRRPGPEGEEAHKEEGEDLTGVRTIGSLSEIVDVAQAG